MRGVDNLFVSIIYNKNKKKRNSMKVVIRNKIYNITKEDVKESLEGVEPEEGKAKYFVEIGGKKYPIKQALSRSLNLSKAMFTTQHAFDILTKLGLKITEKN